MGSSVVYPAVAAPALLVLCETDDLSHAAFRSARRSFCGELVTGPCPHPAGEPSCLVCADTLQELAVKGFVGGKVRCAGLALRSRPCQREPLPGSDYCPSHKHLGVE